MFHKTPSYDSLRVFGCLCFPYLHPHNTNKLQFCSKRCVFIGYSLNHQGYYCLDPSTGHVYLSWHVVFYEQSFPFKETISTNPSEESSTAIFTPTLELITSPHMPHSLNIPPMPPLFPPFNNRILNKTYKKYNYIMHFKKGILGIWLKYNVIPPRCYTIPSYGIQI